MVLYALGHNNQIASGSLARRCENDSLMSFCTRRFNWMEFGLTFLTRSGHFFLPRACEAATTLQTSKSSDAVNGAVWPEVQVDDCLFCQPTFQPKTKHLGPMNVLCLVA